jgi:8-oxo-dGTP diphosphatase
MFMEAKCASKRPEDTWRGPLAAILADPSFMTRREEWIMPRHRLPTVTMTTDIVIFTVRDHRLEILLIQRGNPPFQGRWALPGGLLEPEEDLDVCARRELEEETGVTDLPLEQLHTFGAPHRDPRGRVVTVAHYTMVRAERLKPPRAGSDAARVGWFAVDSLPALAFDHAEIIAMARRRLGARLGESAEAFGYLPEVFTLEDMRTVHEIIRGERLDPREFRRRALGAGLIEPAGEVRTGSRRLVRVYRPIRRASS